MFVTTSKRGRHAIGLVCKRDGRHMRGFVNDAVFVAETIGKIAEAAGVSVDEVARPAVPEPSPEDQALQNAPKRIAESSMTNKSRRSR